MKGVESSPAAAGTRIARRENHVSASPLRLKPASKLARPMDSRTYCAHNLTRDAALSLNVSVADPSREHLKIIEILIDGLGSGSDAALLLTPLSDTPKVPRLFACEIVYLDRDLRVVRSTDSASNVDFPPWTDRVESALYLRARTLASTQTQPGDQLTVCDLDAVERHRQSFSPPNAVASECEVNNSPAPVSVGTSAAPEAIACDDLKDSDPQDQQAPQPPDFTPALSSLPEDPPEPSLIPAVPFEPIESSTGMSCSVRFALSTPVSGQRSSQFTRSQSPIWQIAEPANLVLSEKPEESAAETLESSLAPDRSSPPLFNPDAEPPSEELPGWTTPIRTPLTWPSSSPAASAPVDTLREEQRRDYPSDEFAIWRPAITAAPSAIVQSSGSESVEAQTGSTRIRTSPAVPEAVQPPALTPLPDPIVHHSFEEPQIPESVKQNPKEEEGPRFFFPSRIRFFDPAAEPSEDAGSHESPNGGPFNADPSTRWSSHLSPELQAVILQLTDKEKQKGRDRESLAKFAPVKSKPPDRNQKSGKERA
jgi:hypothetical protein